MKQFLPHKRVFFFIAFIISGITAAYAQVPTRTPITHLKQIVVNTGSSSSAVSKAIASDSVIIIKSNKPTAAPLNDNFASATPLVIATTNAAPTLCLQTCQSSTLQAGETVDCQGFNSATWVGFGAGPATTPGGTVWYSFTPTAVTGTGPYFITLQETTLKQAFGTNEMYHGLSVWNTAVLPSGVCHPMQCMDNEDVGEENWNNLVNGCGAAGTAVDQPNFAEYSVAVNNLVLGTPYYIQVGYATTAFADKFCIGVSTVMPAASTLTNPLPVTAIGQCSASGGCVAATCPLIPDECPLTGCYAPLGGLAGNNCSSGGNINVCVACPAVGTTGDCEPCMTWVTTNCPTSSLFINSNVTVAGFPNSSYPDVNAAIPGSGGSKYKAWPNPASTSGGVLSPGYVISFCYNFTIPGTNSSSTASLQTYFPDGAAWGICGGLQLQGEYWVDWTLYNGNCGSVLQCGTLNSLQLSGTACSTPYVLCNSQQMAAATFIGNDPNGLYPIVTFTQCNPVACNPLPIQIASFGAEYFQASNSVRLDWSTSSEKNNRLFTVQKSLDGTTWETVTTLDGAGNSDQMLYYGATDESPWAGLSYYRLMQTDYDGSSTFSRVVTCVIPADYFANIFPNPTPGDLTLRYGTTSPGPISVKLTDLSGKPIMDYVINEVKKGINEYPVHTSNLSNGMYLIQVSNSEKTFYLKFVRQ